MTASFLKRGREAARAYEKAEAEAEARSKQSKARRYFVPRDAEGMVTFLDGNLRKNGLLDVPSFQEHRLKLNGHWRNYFPCTADEEPCPLCEQGDLPSLVTLFTVIDHSKWKDKNGKKHQHERRLFAAKRDTLKTLQKMASKRGGLTGWRVSISRHGDRSPEVGSAFDFLEQYDLESLREALNLTEEDVQPFDYEEVIRYYSAEELRELGFGSNVMGQHDKARFSKHRRDDDDDEDEEDDPFAKAKVKSKAKPPVDDDEDEEEAPKAKTKSKAKPADDDDEDDDIPAGKAPAGKKSTKPPFEVDDDDDEDDTGAAASDEDDDDDEPAPPPKKKGGLGFLKRSGKTPAKKGSDDEDED